MAQIFNTRTGMAATIIPLLVALLFSLDGADAFFNPIQHPSWASPHKQRPHADGAAIRNRTPPSPFTTPNRKSGWISPTIHTMSQDEIAETVDENVARLRETAAQVREQAAALEFQREVTRRKNADQSFKIFDANKDGFVDASDLQAGLEPPLRASYTKQLAVRMGRKPTREEVDHRIATELPGGKLFPDELAQKLVAAYDQNNDGVLQQSEFAPTEELRARLESMFRAQREEELEARIAERKLQAAERANEKGGAGNAGGAVIARNGINDGLPTAADKVLSALPYLLPLMDSLSYAGHLFTAYPDQMAWAQPLAGLLLAFRSIPFSTLVAFFGLSALAGMPQINKLVRYNIRQAINLDIALIAPGLLGTLTSASLGHDAYKLMPLAKAGSDIVVVTLSIVVAYSIGSSALGAFPNKLPLLGRLNRENPDKGE